MPRRTRRSRPTSITSLPESAEEELARRQKRYAIMAAIFVPSFALSAVLHRYTAVALTLCAIAVVALVLAVVGANVRTPRRPTAPTPPPANRYKQLPPGD